jgi:hypothetical protein
VCPIEELRVVRIASGDRNGQSDEIRWNITHSLDHHKAGQLWEDDRLSSEETWQALAWCMETQKSWISDERERDSRRARKHLKERVTEDYHHMEPVLVHKADLGDTHHAASMYGRSGQGNPINQNEYATVALIQIHFKQGNKREGDRSSRVIKLLSQSLSGELLSLHDREKVFEKEMRLEKERKEICDILAHDFRNIMAGLGFAYRAVNNEISYLRESWERLVHQLLPELPSKHKILEELNRLLQRIAAADDSLRDCYEITKLNQYQNQMLECCLLPEQNDFYLQQKIRPLWNAVLSGVKAEPETVSQIEVLLQKLKESFYLILEEEVIDKINHLSENIKKKWIKLAYSQMNNMEAISFEQYIELLNNENVGIPRQSYSKRNLIYLKQLINLIPQVEIKLNNSLAILKTNNSLSELT